MNRMVWTHLIIVNAENLGSSMVEQTKSSSDVTMHLDCLC